MPYCCPVEIHGILLLLRKPVIRSQVHWIVLLFVAHAALRIDARRPLLGSVLVLRDITYIIIIVIAVLLLLYILWFYGLFIIVF